MKKKVERIWEKIGLTVGNWKAQKDEEAMKRWRRKRSRRRRRGLGKKRRGVGEDICLV